MTTLTGSLLLLGCGKMGGALLDGWLAGGVEAANVHIVDPGLKADQVPSGCNLYAEQAELPADLTPQIAILAIKPQMMDGVLPGYQGVLGQSLLVSIAAGKDMAYFQNIFGTDARIVRVMPNTPAAVGRGISALVASNTTSDADKDIATHLMQAVSETVWLDGEHQMNAATAVSGSGPAYVFHLIEAMAAAGVANGLSEDVAQKLARVTVCGAGELAWKSDDEASTLRKNVTSPGGTTAEALNVLMRDTNGLTSLMTEAVEANMRRSEELARGE